MELREKSGTRLARSRSKTDLYFFGNVKEPKHEEQIISANVADAGCAAMHG
jgi:hypothetical protein